VADAPRRLDMCRRALHGKDIELLARVVEQDSDLMHSVMMTSTPPLRYRQPATLGIMRQVRNWRDYGWPVLYTVDAGPNVHVICLASHAEKVAGELGQIPGVEQVLLARPGGPARLEPSPTDLLKI